jgi:predicted dehydrogenase
MQQLPREEKWGYVQEDRAFIDAIVNGSEPLVTAFDGLMSVRLVMQFMNPCVQSPVRIQGS